MVDRFLGVAIVFALLAPAPAYAQTRAELIAGVVRESAADMPYLRKEVLPRVARDQAREQLERLGKETSLGPEWKPGNTHWDRAEALLVKDLAAGLERLADRDLQATANLKDVLAELSDAQLRELLNFYRSEVYRKSTRYADASLAMMFVALSAKTPQAEAQAQPIIARLQAEVQRNSLSKDEEAQLDRTLKSPAFQLIARNGSIQMQALAGGFMQPSSSDAGSRGLASIVNEFRVAQNRSPEQKAAPAGADRTADLNRRLLAAVKTVNAAQVASLIAEGAQIDTADVRPYLGDTPLHHAARTGSVEVASVLIDKGANVNVRGPSGYTPLHVASGLNRRAVAEYLLKRGADPNAMDTVGTPLHVATLAGHPALVQVLLEQGANPNARRPNDGRTPLHMFSQINQYFEPGHTRVIEMLVARGADVNAKDSNGQTPLDGADKAAIAPLGKHGAVRSSAR